jgi:hypothetical protein
MGRDLQGKIQAFMLLFGAAFVAGGSLSAWVAFDEARVAYPLMQSGARADGEIFDFDHVRTGGRWKNIALLRFTPEGGAEQVVHSVGHNLGRGRYPVLYLPDNPATARIDRFEAMWLWFCIASAGTLLLAIPGLAMVRKGLAKI